MSPKQCLAAQLLLGMLVSPWADARSLPAPGGVVRVAVPENLRSATERALTSAPLLAPMVQRSDAAAAALPTLPGTTWASRLLTSLEPTADASGWRLDSRTPANPLAAAVRACLEDPAVWPSQVLSAARVQVRVSSRESLVSIDLTRSFGPLPALLAGCDVPQGGAFSALAGGYSRRSGPDGGLLARVELTDLPEADVSTGQVGFDRGDALAGPWPDVLLLVLDPMAQALDPFTLGERAAGWPVVQAQLAADLLVAVRRGGRGGAADGILPPGVGPSRPPFLPGPATSARLPLTPLPPDGPTLRIDAPGDDPLHRDVVGRLALLLRARGWATSTADGPGPRARLHVFRAPTEDPALALLALAGTLGLSVPEAALSDLLSLDPATRAAAAWAMERNLVETRAVLPLLQATHWIDVHPLLHGVRLRADGVPILDDASWGWP